MGHCRSALLVLCMALPWHAGAQDKAMSSEELARQVSLLEEPATAAALDKWSRQLAPVMQSRLRDLAASGEARKLYVAGRLWDTAQVDADPEDSGTIPQSSRQSVAWLQAAIDARPRDPLVARVEQAACPQGVSCDTAGALRFLLEAEPDNAEIQLRAMHDAQRRGDAAGSEHHWQAAVLSTRYDASALPLARELHEAYRGLTLPLPAQDVAVMLERVVSLGLSVDPQAIADIEAMNLFATQAMPSFQGLLQHCRAPASDAQRDECMSLLGLMADDESTLIGPIVALKMMVDLTAGTQNQAPWAQRLRELKWLQQSIAPLTSQPSPLPGGTMADYFDVFLREGELATYWELLRANDLPLVPPEGWQASRQ